MKITSINIERVGNGFVVKLYNGAQEYKTLVAQDVKGIKKILNVLKDKRAI